MTRRTAQMVRSPVARRAPTARSWALTQTRSEDSGAKADRMATISAGRSKGVGLRERWLVCHHRSWPTTPWIGQPIWPKSSWREWRRIRALDLKRQGWKQRHIATALDASEAAVSQWLAAARRGGPDAPIARTSRRGTTPKLAPEQVRLIPDFLWHGAEASGFRGDGWTGGRAVDVLAEESGVSYSKSQVSRLLKRLGWTPQVPITRAIQRDEAAIERWRVESWPALKERTQDERRKLV